MSGQMRLEAFERQWAENFRDCQGEELTAFFVALLNLVRRYRDTRCGVRRFVSRIISETRWSVKRLNPAGVVAFTTLSRRIDETPSECINLSPAALAEKRARDGARGKQISLAISRNLSTATTRELARMVRALFVYDRKGLGILPSIVEAFSKRVANCDPDELIEIALTFARAKSPQNRLMIRIADRAVHTMAQFSSSQVARLLWAFAVLNTTYSSLLNVAAERASALIPEMSGYDITWIAWGLAFGSVSLAAQFLTDSAARLEEAVLGPADLVPLCHACQIASVRFPAKYRSQLEHQFAALAAEAPSPNEFESSVGEVSRRLGFEVEMQPCIDGILADLVVTVQGRRVVVECDGPEHVIGRSSTKRVPGRDVMQDRVLHRLGYPVLHITSSDWEQVSKKDAWLRSQIERLIKVAD